MCIYIYIYIYYTPFHQPGRIGRKPGFQPGGDFSNDDVKVIESFFDPLEGFDDVEWY